MHSGTFQCPAIVGADERGLGPWYTRRSVRKVRMRAVPCRTPNRGSLVLGIAAAIALIVSPCSSTSATGSVGTFADHSGGLEDSVRDDVRALVGQFDEVVNQLSEFQVSRACPLAPAGVAANLDSADFHHCVGNRSGVRCWRGSLRSVPPKTNGSCGPSNLVCRCVFAPCMHGARILTEDEYRPVSLGG